MAAASHVQKTGQNSFHGYAYASDADLLRVIQPAMAKAGLAMVPSQIAQTETKLDKGKMQTDVHVQYLLVHTSGETLPVQATGRGIDKEDKGPYKAMTGALKYALRQTFLVPTGDDPEVHTRAYEPEPPITRERKKPVVKKPVAKKPVAKKPVVKKPVVSAEADGGPDCPKCGGPMHDFSDKRNSGSRAPAYKCKSGHYNSQTKMTEGCAGVIWDPVGSTRRNARPADTLVGSADPWADEEIPF
jgi:hypothetical protein